MEPNFDLHFGREKKSKRSGKAGKGAAKRWMAILLTVILVAGNCVPVTAAEVSDATGADSAGITEEYEQEPETVSEEQNAGEEGTQAFSDEESEEDGKSEAAEESDTSEETGADEEEADGAPAEESETETAATEISGSDEGDEQTNAADPSEENAETGLTEDDAVLEEPLEAEEVSKEALAQADGWLADYDYNIISLDEIDEVVYLFGYNGSETDITVPGTVTIDGVEYPVTASPDTWGSIYPRSIVFGDGFIFTNDLVCFFRYYSRELESVDMSRADTSRLTSMNRMFYRCSSLKYVNLGDIDTSNVSDVSYMFRGCSAIEEIDLHCLSNAQITDAGAMFRGCSSLQTLDLSGVNLVMAMEEGCGEFFINGCTSLQEIVAPVIADVADGYGIDLPGYYTDGAGNIYNTLKSSSVSGRTLHVVEFPSWLQDYKYDLDVDNRTITLRKYQGEDKELTVPGSVTIGTTEVQIRLAEKDYIWGSGVTKLTFGNVKFSGYLKRLFYNATGLRYLDLSEADFSEAEYADSMLTRCEKLKTILAPAGLTVFVKLPSTFFDENDNQYTQLPKKLTGSIELHTIPISEWLEDYTYQISGDTIILKYYSGEDVDLTVPTSAAIGSTTYDKIRILRGVWPRSIVSLSFEGPVDLSHYTYTMFKNMNQLEQLDLSNQSEVLYNANEMFYNCSKLQEIDLSGFDFSQCSKTNNMFYGCKALQTIKTPVNVSVEVELPGVYSDSEGNLYSSIPANQENSITLTKVTDVSEWLNDYEFGVEGDRIVLKKHNRGYYQTLTVPGNAVVGNKEFHKVELSRNMWGNAQAVHLSFEEGVILPQDSSGLFRNLRATSIDLSNVNTGEATDMSDMFTGCSNLNTIITPKNVKCDANLPRAFTDDSGNLYSYLPKNLNASVTLTRVDQSSWLNKFNYVISGDKIILTNYTAGYTSNLTVPGSAEVNGTSFGKIEIAKTINWSKYYIRNLSFSEGVVFPEDSSGMFENCTYLRSIDISNVDTSNVVNMSRMFYRCKACTALDVSHFDTSKVTDMSEMFYDCCKLTTLDVSGFDTSNVTNMCQMFGSCSRLTSLNLSGFNTSNVTDMSGMFCGCESLTGLNVSGLDTSGVTDMSQMFYNCKMLTALDTSGLDTSGVTDMSQMFYNCEMLTTFDTSGFDTSNVRNMRSMFQGCSSLNTLDVSGFNTSNATDLSNMFYHCDNVNALDVSGFDTSNVTSLYAMFGHCRSVKYLNVNGFDTSNTENISYMFYRCTSLLKLDISNWDLSSVVDGYRFFGNGDTLGMIKSPVGLSVHIDLPAIYTGSDGKIYKELPRNKDKSIVLTWTSYYDDVAYSESGNPWSSESGNPWSSESGNPWSSESGNPWSSESGNPWSSESGNPWSSESGNPTQGPIRIVEQPEDVRAMAGKTAIFKVTASGTDLSYQWQWSTDGMTWKNCASRGYNTDTFSFMMRDNFDGRMYRCVITRGTRKAYTRFASLTLAQVEVTEQPEDVEAAPGESVMFHVEADGIDPAYQWQWSNDGGTTWKNCTSSGYNMDTFSFKMKSTYAGRQYRCVVSAGGDEVASDPANLTLWTEPEFIFQPEDAEAAAGERVTFHVEVDGKDPVYQWQWSADGATWKNCTSSGYNTDTFSFVMRATFAGRQYRCVVQCGRTTLTSEAGTITLVVNPEIISQPSDVEAAVGETVTFSVVVQGDDPTYQWQYSKDGGTNWVNCTAAGSNTSNFSFKMLKSMPGRLYRCQVTIGTRTKVSETATLKLAFRITQQPADAEALVGETVSFQVTASGTDLSYQWQYSKNGGSTWLNCTSKGYNTDCFAFTMTKSMSGRLYRCVVKEGGNQLISEAATIKLAFSITKQPADVEAAVGETVSFQVTASGTDLSYQWQYSKDGGSTWLNSTSTGYNTNKFTFGMSKSMSGRLYRCVVTEDGNQLISEAATLTLAFKITKQPADVEAAVGETVSFQVTASGTNLSYQWQYSKDGGSTWLNCTSTGYNTNSFTFKMTKSMSGRKYSCKVTCGEQTLISEPATITLHENAVMH